MEECAIDDLYGDLDQEAHGFSDAVPNNDEDSVDIYSGLEDSPKSHGQNGKSRAFFSPQRLKASMDLYEELITKEQEEKATTYHELKSKFDAAQNHVQELVAQLQQMQTQNSSLHKENTLLKKNICALIKTARMEIVRKDDEISKLSKRSGRGIFHMSGLDRSPASSNNGLNSKRSQDPKGGWGLESSQHKDKSILTNLLGKSTLDSTQSHPVVLRQRARSDLNLESPLNCQNMYMESQLDSHQRDGTKSIDTTHGKERDKLRSSCYDRTYHSKQVDILEKPPTTMDKNKSEKEQDSFKESCTESKTQQQQHDGGVISRRSGRSRSPNFQTQFTSTHTCSSESTSHSSKLPSKLNNNTLQKKENTQHNQAEKRQSGRADVCGSRSGTKSSISEKGSSEKCGASLDQNVEKRRTREHHRKEERRHEDGMSSAKRCTRNEVIRDGAVKNVHEDRNRNIGSSKGNKSSTRPEASKEPERQSATKNDRGTTDKTKDKQVLSHRDKGHRHGDTPENRQNAAAVKPDLRKDHDKRKNSSRSQGESYKSKASKSRSDCMDGKSLYASADRSSVKEKYASVDYEKGRVKSDKKSKNEKLGSSSSDKSRFDVCKQSPKRSTTSSGTPAELEESSPKRKLSFMETLNLTLSPIKKQTNPDKAKESLQPSPALETESIEDRLLFELGEEFCIVDETENSQQSLEVIVSPANVTGETLQRHPADGNLQPSQGQDVTPGSKESPLLGNEKELELPKMDGEPSDRPADDVCMDPEMQDVEPVTKADESRTCISQNSPDSQGVVAETNLPLKGCDPIDGPSSPSADMCRQQNNEAPVNEILISNDSSKDLMANEHDHPPSFQNDLPQQDVSTSAEVKASSKTCSANTSVVLDGVSSTVTVDLDFHIDNCCNTQETAGSYMGNTKAISQENSDTLEEPQTDGCNINPANVEEGVPPELTSYSEPDSTENEGKIIEPPTSVPLVPPDEDSMMLTLCSIKVIPEAISPLTSPVRQMKKGQQQYLGKEHHVKSLSKDFSSSIPTNKDTTKMDMNKENERPNSSVVTSVEKEQKEALSSAGAEEELEEGEIISESDEEGALVIQSPPNQNRRLSSRIQSSPRSPSLEKTNQIKAAVTPDREQVKHFTAASKDSPTSSKRRFKTVSVPPKASISSAAEFLNMFSYIRSELRRKYMKLHKNVTKTAFRCIIDMSLASFTEFIDNVNFQKFCSQGTEIKLKINKIISTVISKLSCNGIVNRIFEQRAGDLKQKLWNFVDGQFDFLFKEVKAALKRVTDISTNKSLLNMSSGPKEDLELCKIQPKEPLTMAENRPPTLDNIVVVNKVQQKTIPSQTSHCNRRGLGSSGKGIKVSIEDGPNVLGEQMCNQEAVVSSDKSQEPGNDSKTLEYVRRHSQNGSVQDRSDFEILTEQQASSLTFNLVTDSQMGDIFRCLLQGSDLLDAAVSAGDNQSWPLNTPRKDGPPGENLIGVMTPSKVITPSKVVTTWTSITPCKFASPNSKFQMSINPALLDENCLLEVPSTALTVQTSAALTNSQQPYCILADDLAVSLTIPSPLKSDGHLSFLNPDNGQPLSVPNDVIAAHYSEDALLDGEDATEQDIHLSLDTDNSSCGSSTNGNQAAPNTALFLFKPDLHMQAEVMEKSNDHFILRIRHTSPEEPKHKLEEAQAESSVTCHEDKTSVISSSLSEATVLTPLLTTSNTVREAQTSNDDTPFLGLTEGASPANLSKPTGSPAQQTATETRATSATESEQESESQNSCHRRTRKRKKHHSGPKVKSNRRDKSQDNHDKKRHKRSKSSKEKREKTPSPQLSPNSLSAHNVVRKKGEVVVTWTREEDRDILVELKTKGASVKTFVALSTKLRKSQAQIEERFNQLLKLFKKKEKMEG